MPNLDFYADMLSEDLGDTLGGRMSTARDLAATGLEALSARLGVSQQLLRAWESDRAAPSPLQLFALAGVLGVSPMWLSSGIGEGPDDIEDEAVLERLKSQG